MEASSLTTMHETGRNPFRNLCKTEGLEQMDVALVDFTAG
jgi:hypothetical protein